MNINSNATVGKTRSQGNDNNSSSSDHSSRLTFIIGEFGGNGCLTDKLVRLYKYRANKMTELSLLEEAIRVVEGQVDADHSSAGDSHSVTNARYTASAETDKDGILMGDGANLPGQLTAATPASTVLLTLSTNTVISALYEAHLKNLFPIEEGEEKCSTTTSTTLTTLLDTLHSDIKTLIEHITPIAAEPNSAPDFLKEDSDLATITTSIPIEALSKLVVIGEELSTNDQELIKDAPSSEIIDTIRSHLYDYLISLIAFAVSPDTWGLKEAQKSLKIAVVGTKREINAAHDVRVLLRAVVMLALISKPTYLQKIPVNDINKATKAGKECTQHNIAALYTLPFLAPVMSDTIGAPFALRVIGYIGQQHGGFNSELPTLLTNLATDKSNGNVLRKKSNSSATALSSKANVAEVSDSATPSALNFFLELSSHASGVKIISKVCDMLETTEEFHMFVRLLLGLNAVPTVHVSQEEYKCANNAIIHLMRDLNGNTILMKLMSCNTLLQSYTPCIKTSPSRSEEGYVNAPVTDMTPEELLADSHIRKAQQLLFCTIIHNSIALSCSRQGCCFMQRCLQCFNDDDLVARYQKRDSLSKFSEENNNSNANMKQGVSYRQKLINTVLSETITLSQDSFGNYVVQFLLDQQFPLTAVEAKEWQGKDRDEVQWGTSQQVSGSNKKIADQASRRRANREIAASFHPYTNRIIRQLLHNIAALSQNKFSSNVIEKCLKTTVTDVKQLLIDEITDPGTLPKLLTDRFGNYVVQSAITSSSSGKQFTQVREAILPHSQLLKHSPYGLNIETKLERRLQEQRMSNKGQKQQEDVRSRCGGKGRTGEQASFTINSNNMRYDSEGESVSQPPQRGGGSWPQQTSGVISPLQNPIHDHYSPMNHSIIQNSIPYRVGKYGMDLGALPQPQNMTLDGTGGFGSIIQPSTGLPHQLSQGLIFPSTNQPTNLGTNPHLLLQPQHLLAQQQYYMMQQYMPQPNRSTKPSLMQQHDTPFALPH